MPLSRWLALPATGEEPDAVRHPAWKTLPGRFTLPPNPVVGQASCLSGGAAKLALDSHPMDASPDRRDACPTTASALRFGGSKRELSVGKILPPNPVVGQASCLSGGAAKLALDSHPMDASPDRRDACPTTASALRFGERVAAARVRGHPGARSFRKTERAFVEANGHRFSETALRTLAVLREAVPDAGCAAFTPLRRTRPRRAGDLGAAGEFGR